MDQPITRKFYKPIRGRGELRQAGQRIASVRFYLQGWRDFSSRAEANAAGDRPADLSGMEGEVTLSAPDRKRLPPEQILYQVFDLITERDEVYPLTAYKLKDEAGGKGRYSVRCLLER